MCSSFWQRVLLKRTVMTSLININSPLTFDADDQLRGLCQGIRPRLSPS
jgi:hypothetical protein